MCIIRLWFYSNPFVNNEADRHGTNMAGLIASHPNNSICSVGVAYDVNLGHVRVLAKNRKFVEDQIEAKALAFRREKIDIYVLGYGSTQLGIGNLRTQAKTAVQQGTKGTILSSMLLDFAFFFIFLPFIFTYLNLNSKYSCFPYNQHLY